MHGQKNVKFMKIRPVGSELFHAVGQAGGHAYMTKVIVTFPSFANAPVIQ